MVVLITALTTATYFIVKKIIHSNKKKKELELEEALREASDCYVNRKYKESIVKYKEILEMTIDDKNKIKCYNGISRCLIKMKNYNEALSFLNKSINMNLKDNIVALRWRSECFRKLENHKMYLKDLILKYKITQDNQDVEKIEKVTFSIVSEETDKFINSNSLPHSNILFSDFFEPFTFILPEENNEIADMMKRKDFRSLNEALMSSNWDAMYSDKCSKGYFTPRSVRASLFFIKGSYEESLVCLKSPSNLFEEVLRDSFECFCKQSEKPLSYLDKVLKSNNHTLIFFLSKIYLYTKEEGKYCDLLNSILNSPFVYYDLLIFYKDRKENGLFRKIATEAIEKFGNTPKFLTICGEFALETKDSDYLMYILRLMNQNDPRCLIFIANYFYIKKDLELAIVHLKKVIVHDPTCFKAYFNLGEILSASHPEDSRRVWTEGLSKASTYNEVFITNHALLILDIKKDLDDLPKY